MPSVEPDNKPSWADQVEDLDEDVDDELPPPEEVIDGDTKIITEYSINDEGKKVKIIRTYRVETRKASKTIARRKAWPKFGDSEYDGPGPNPSTTAICDDIFMTFVTNKEEALNDKEEDPMAKLKGTRIVQCRICKGDHWTTKCPYKDTLGPIQEELEKSDKPGEAAAGAKGGEQAAAARPAGGKYVPPSLRGANRGPGESMAQRRDDQATIRVTNLSEDTRESDLQELFRPFGAISRIYLAKDKVTHQSKGFAFINFHRREDAARAITGVNGFGYDNLILNVEWARPSNQQ
ncbi:PREDICTED: eukaryotic translation initiation factor 3 subunit G-like isoform X3 [Branchiostoma belcheri]|uniref:Eukaryotic translation initiation factor 3 subunit G n=1 Tax=Branchiostoma belcheri TaxID=7741 RepID=A0A6P4XRY4_BRABE|nr:PREDICTED: eukaryotic translation initiation factor 3 subunit G-like isoform X3 [Branchiostoma belcheri]